MEILLLHRQQGRPFPEEWVHHYAYWQTCLREIVLLPLTEKNLWQESFDARYACVEGEAAIRYLVEICAGLHSPVLGETEVFGQFRTRFKNFKHSDPIFERNVREFTSRVVDCTKRVREQCLKGGTSSSYGSLTRRFTKGYTSASFLGAGRLAAEILPWLEHFSVDVHARDPQKASLVAAKHKSAVLRNTMDAPGGEVAVIVAPMTAREIEAWLIKSEQKTKLVLDLRGDSETDGLPSGSADKIITLREFFSELQQNEAKRAQLLMDAKKLLDHHLVFQRERAEFRPFGWEDVCA